MLEPRWHDALNQATRWAPLLAVATVVLYAVGFVVVSASLATYGVRELDPLRPRYIAAAVPFLAAVLSTWFYVRWIASAMALLPMARAPGVVRFLTWVLMYVFAAFSAAFTIWLVLVYATRDYAWIDDMGNELAEFGRIFRFCSTIALGHWLLRHVPKDERLSTLRDPYWLVIVALGAVLSYVPLYSMLPTWVGGGKPDEVRLTLSAPIDGCNECGGANVRLLDADAHRVVIVVGSGSDERAIEIARGQVLAIEHASGARR